MVLRKNFIYYFIFILTILDISLTAIGINSGIIEEGNPIMNYFFQQSMVYSMIISLVIVGLLLFLLYKVRRRVLWLPKALYGITFIKIIVIAMHIRWVAVFLTS